MTTVLNATDDALTRWQQVARATALHDALADWVDRAFERLDYFCASVGVMAPDQREFPSEEGPIAADLAPHIGDHANSIVERVLTLAVAGATAAV